MINILMPLNKSVPKDYIYWIFFLNYLKDELLEKEINLTYLLFSSNLVDEVNTKDIINGERSESNDLSISDIELKYNLSVKELLYVDYLQTSPHVIGSHDRDWYIPETEFNDNPEQITNYLNGIIRYFKEKNFDLVIADQSTDYQMVFIGRLCLSNQIPFIRYLPEFGKRVFFGIYKSARHIEILDLNIGDISSGKVKEILGKFINGENSSIYQIEESSLEEITIGKSKKVYEKILDKSPMHLIESVSRKLKSLYFKNFEEKLKKLIYSPFDKNKDYIFFGFHLTTECHVALHSYPFLNQLSLVEQISRALPYGYLLYVKPHPWWSYTMSRSNLKSISKIPHVRILEPQTPIRDIINNAKLITTINATTGVEALAMAKPVIAFSKINSYTDFNPNAYRCDDPYDLPDLIAKAISSEFDNAGNEAYFNKLFSISSELRFEADRFLSEDDASQKVNKFSSFVQKVVLKLND